MAEQIFFFKKNVIDIDNDEVTITVTDAVATNNGQDFIDFVRNRKNDSAWITTGSTDAANTQIDIDWVTGRDIKDLILVKHNWKNYTIQYYDEDLASFTNFSPSINVTNSTDETTHFEFTSVETSQLRIIITGTQIANADKELYQLIVTEKILTGQLAGWPIIKNPVHSTNKRKTKMLSGKTHVAESLGFFACELTVASWKIDNDLDIIENIYFRREGFLVWLCGGDESQFSTIRRGYRKEDIFLMRPVNEYEPEFRQGQYQQGLAISLKLEESIN